MPIYKINNFVDTRFDFGKIPCLRYAHMRAHGLKAVGHVLAAAVGRLAPQAHGGAGVSQAMTRLLRLIEGGVDVEALPHKSRGRRNRPAEPTKGSNTADPKSEGRQRARENRV